MELEGEMLSVEIRINGTTIIHKTARRTEPLRNGRGASPWYEYITDDDQKIFHDYNYGVEGLAIKLLEMAANKRRISESKKH